MLSKTENNLLLWSSPNVKEIGKKKKKEKIMQRKKKKEMLIAFHGWKLLVGIEEYMEIQKSAFHLLCA